MFLEMRHSHFCESVLKTMKKIILNFWTVAYRFWSYSVNALILRWFNYSTFWNTDEMWNSKGALWEYFFLTFFCFRETRCFISLRWWQIYADLPSCVSSVRSALHYSILSGPEWIQVSSRHTRLDSDNKCPGEAVARDSSSLHAVDQGKWPVHEAVRCSSAGEPNSNTTVQIKTRMQFIKKLNKIGNNIFLKNNFFAD